MLSNTVQVAVDLRREGDMVVGEVRRPEDCWDDRYVKSSLGCVVGWSDYRIAKLKSGLQTVVE